MKLKITSVLVIVSALGLGGCVQGPHKHGMMGGGMMAKSSGCPMMQNQAHGASGGMDGKGTDGKGMDSKGMDDKGMGRRDMAEMEGCKMMGNAAPKPPAADEHSDHHPKL